MSLSLTTLVNSSSATTKGLSRMYTKESITESTNYSSYCGVHAVPAHTKKTVAIAVKETVIEIDVSTSKTSPMKGLFYSKLSQAKCRYDLGCFQLRAGSIQVLGLPFLAKTYSVFDFGRSRYGLCRC